MLVHGKNMILQVGGHTVAACRECSLDLSRNMIEIAGDSATAQSFIPGRYGATLSTSGLYGITSASNSSKSLAETLINGTMVAFAFQANEDTYGNCDVYSGMCYVDKFSPSGSYRSLATYSATFRATGNISIERTKLHKYTWKPTFRYCDNNGDYHNITQTYNEGHTTVHFVDGEASSIISDVGVGYAGLGICLEVTPNIKDYGVSVSASQYYTKVMDEHPYLEGYNTAYIREMADPAILEWSIAPTDRHIRESGILRVLFNQELDHIVEFNLR